MDFDVKYSDRWKRPSLCRHVWSLILIFGVLWCLKKGSIIKQVNLSQELFLCNWFVQLECCLLAVFHLYS